MDEKRGRFEVEVLPYLDAAYRFARRLARPPVEVDDIVQEAILRAFRGYETLRSPDARGWLLAIVRNCHAEAVKQRHRRAHVPLPEESDARDGYAVVATTPDPESASIRGDDQRALDRVISGLPDDHREVLVLREVENLGYREIALVMNVPIGTVMSRLARARMALKARWMQEIGGAPRAVR
jgi:RNA polymerase sigma factor (sigma-70 family)